MATKRAALERARLTKRIQAQEKPRHSRYCSCCANKRGPNTPHYLCPECLRFTAGGGRCCGVWMISVTCIARVPKKGASRKKWAAFIERFVLPGVETRLGIARAKGEEPPAGWAEFCERWGGTPRELKVASHEVRLPRQSHPKKRLGLAISLLEEKYQPFLLAGYGIDGREAMSVEEAAKGLGVAPSWMKERIVPEMLAALTRMIPYARRIEDASGERLVRALARLAEDDPAAFERVMARYERDFASRITPPDLLPLLESEEVSVRQAALFLSGLLRRRRRRVGAEA